MPQPYLPQNEPNPEKRNNDLSDQQQAYEYDYKYLPPLVLLKKIPAFENFSAQYIAERVVATSELVPNMLAAKARSFLDPLDDIKDYEDLFTLLPLPEVAKVYQTNNSFAEQRLSGANPFVIRLLDEDDPRSQVLEQIPSFKDDFEPLFDVRKELAAGNIYITDYTGTDEYYRGPSMVQGGTYEKGRKYLPKPLAFFWWQRTGISDRGKLVPIAIQLDASKNSKVYTPTNSKVYTPFEQNPLDWLFAKLCVQIADGNHHEMSSHLCRTHFVMEPIAIGTAHQLAENHPLSLLLRPHFLFMLTNNHLGQQRLINPGGPVDELLAGTLPESMELVKDAYEGWNIKEFAFPTEIKNRGMDNTERLPHYPYRDDGMLVWKAIHTFVSDYVNHFYPTPEDITGDTELQAWAKELSDQSAQTNGGKVKGMPTSFTTVQELIEIVTTIIFICGPQHSAVNYAQDGYMTFAANMPLAAYRDIPKQSHKPQDQPTATPSVAVQTTAEQTTAEQTKAVEITADKATLDQNTVLQKRAVQTTTVEIPEDQITEEQILKLLPPYKRTADQLQSLFVLSAYQYDRLGYYEKAFQQLYNDKFEDVFKDDNNQAIIAIVRQFQQNLNMVEQEIDANNKKRVVPYLYLKPSLILNSISI
ncbi:Arachidonate 15-lipoxygenase [Crinalium epipsammum PCC 9333]|uniref:Arachidonate 15-lipoxygenase n=1 Tax=Crinalium epipsammum PCC 9333 TaxID=1173022 RepID=K9W3M2_9CYAN|nr:lipoxygenase family protein [Crinalium epipsammum]AFZ14357.1 Arachidonate 15-lipoxygenase [Crinalium epipsammum PCC 9333]